MRVDDSADQTLEGTLERIVFTTEDEQFSVAIFSPDGGGEIRVVGNLVGLRPGERVRLIGKHVNNPRFGDQFRVDAGYPLLPFTAEGIRNYLKSGRIKGIGPALAGRMVDHFGADTLRIIDESPERLSEVSGIGKRRRADIQTALADQQGLRAALVFLQGHGIPPGLAGRIWRRYQNRAIPVVRENPYRLAIEVRGIGFATADRIAGSLGFAPDAPARLAAGLVHVLASAEGEGHLYLPRDVLLERTVSLLGDFAIDPVLTVLIDEGRLIEDTRQIYLRINHALEIEAVELLESLLAEVVSVLPTDLTKMERELGLTLADAQREAVEQAGDVAVMVLTGGPGTGKTTIVQALVHLLEGTGGKVLLAAPTGRAARRMSDATGADARTLHRLLEYTPMDNCFRRDQENPLDAAAVVVDEASMIDQRLFVALLRAIKPGTRLLLVGDADQLPSVGAGNVLGDLIDSDRVPTVRLTEIFRQAAASRIVQTAHRVLLGERPTPPPTVESDFFLIEARDASTARDLIERLVAERIPARFGLDPIDDVQVLTPMHKGICGAKQLNSVLQARLNPDGEPCSKGDRVFRVGDKVMQIRNDYEKEVFNGDLGRVIARSSDGITVRFDGRLVAYPRDKLDALVLAYACSIHKSQGSEYPAVVIPMLTEHWVMLQRNLLYTALTRGRQLVVIVGQRRALERAVAHRDESRRYTAMADRLRAHL